MRDPVMLYISRLISSRQPNARDARSLLKQDFLTTKLSSFITYEHAPLRPMNNS